MEFTPEEGILILRRRRHTYSATNVTFKGKICMRIMPIGIHHKKTNKPNLRHYQIEVLNSIID
jgi:hypothetical protein